MSDIILSSVPADKARDVWPYVNGRIWRAMNRGGLGSYRIVKDMILDGRAMLWLAQDGERIHAVAVTSLAITEWRKVCEITALAGSGMRNWFAFLPAIERYAKNEGCSSMRLMGRKGWARVLKDYKSKHVILEKDLT